MNMERVKFKDILQIKHGYAFKGEFFTDEDTGQLILTPGNFTLKGGFQETKKFTTEKDFPSEFVLKSGDLIVTMTDLSKAIDTIGFSALVPNNADRKYLHNQRIGLVKVFNPEFDKDYVYWVMRTGEYQRTIANTSNGATVHHTSPDRIYKYWCRKFPLSTQRKIASILSSYDSLIENNTKRIRLLEQMAENLYKEWFVRFRFPRHENTEFVDGLPKGWKYEKLGRIAKISTGKCNREDAEDDGKYPLFDRSQEIKKSNIWLKDCEAIIVPGEGTTFIPRYFKGKFNLHQRCYCVEPQIDDTGKFLFYVLLLNRKYFLSVATGATVPSLRQKNFTSMKFLMPELNLCRQFNQFASNLFSEIDSFQQQSALLTRQRDLLLPRLMSGKLEVKS